MKQYAAVVLGLVLVWMVVLRVPAPPIRITVAMTDIGQATGDGWRDEWCEDFLRRVGQEHPSQGLVDFCWEWTMAEDVSDGAFERNNPLNTTQESPSVTMVFNSHGVKGYATLVDGLEMSVVTIRYGYYVEVVDAIMRNDPDDARRALWHSPWAAGHYDYGARWPRRHR